MVCNLHNLIVVNWVGRGGKFIMRSFEGFDDCQFGVSVQYAHFLGRQWEGLHEKTLD